MSLAPFWGRACVIPRAKWSGWKARPARSMQIRPVSLPQPVSLADVQLPETTSLAGRSDNSHRGRWAFGLGALIGLRSRRLGDP